MFGKKKEEFTLIHLGDLIKSSTKSDPGEVEKFEYNSEHLTLILVNQAGNKLVRRVDKIKKKYVFFQELTGGKPLMLDTKKLLDFVNMFPVFPETKKSLSKKYY